MYKTSEDFIIGCLYTFKNERLWGYFFDTTKKSMFVKYNTEVYGHDYVYFENSDIVDSSIFLFLKSLDNSYQQSIWPQNPIYYGLFFYKNKNIILSYTDLILKK